MKGKLIIVFLIIIVFAGINFIIQLFVPKNSGDIEMKLLEQKAIAYYCHKKYADYDSFSACLEQRTDKKERKIVEEKLKDCIKQHKGNKINTNACAYNVGIENIVAERYGDGETYPYPNIDYNNQNRDSFIIISTKDGNDPELERFIESNGSTVDVHTPQNYLSEIKRMFEDNNIALNYPNLQYYNHLYNLGEFNLKEEYRIEELFQALLADESFQSGQHFIQKFPDKFSEENIIDGDAY